MSTVERQRAPATPPAPTYHFRNFHVPPNMMRGLLRYINHGIKPGQFLTAVLENNLVAACKYGDDLSLCNLPAFTAYLYNQAPCYCWGSPDKVAAWIERGGLQAASNETSTGDTI